jgi:hypothetical protein
MSCFLQSIRLTVKVISSKSAVVMPMSSGDSVSSAVDVSKTGIGRDVASGEPSLVAFEPLTRVMTRANSRTLFARNWRPQAL